jgi:TP901 family phage tail tape measure protein
MILGAYGSSQINIGLNVHLRDNFSGPAAQVKAAFGSLKDELKMYQENLRAARNMYGQLFAAGSLATMGMAGMYKEGAKFDYVIRGAAAAAGSSNSEFKQLFDLANKIGGTTMFTPGETGQAMRELGLANFDTKGILQATEPIVNLAGASMTNLATSAQIAINTMYQFNKTAADMGNITDLLTYASNKSAINLTDLGESLKYVSATGVDLGQSLPDVLAMLMVLGNAGLKGSISGVAIENMMRYMALGLGQYGKTGRAKAWEAFGLNPKDLVTQEGDLKPVMDIFKAMSVASSKMGDVDKQNMLYQVFNVRGKRAGSKLLQQLGQWEKYRNALNTQEGKPGFAKNIMNFMMGGPEGDIQRMHGAWLSFVNEFTQAVAPLAAAILGLLRGITKLMTLFTGNPIGRVITAWIAGLIVLKTVVWGLKFAFSTLALSQSYLHGSFTGMKTAMMTGWQQLTGAASAYGSTVMAVGIASMRAGMGVGGKAGGFKPAFFSNAGLAANLAMNGVMMGAGGRFFKKGMFGGVTRISTAAGLKAATTYVKPVGFGAGMGRSLFQSRVAAGGAGALLGATGGNLIKKLGTGALSRVLGFAGGPWGIALTAALTLLPMIFGSLTGSLGANTEATNKNTESTEKSAVDNRLALARLSDAIGTKEREVSNLYAMAGANKNMADWLLERRKNEYLSDPAAYGNRKFYDMSKPGTVSVYVAGKLTETINHELNKQLNVIINP